MTGGCWAGCPESIRLMSSSGPLGPIFLGVWQSLQPPMATKCSPHFTWLSKPPYCIFAFIAESEFEPAEFSEAGCWLHATIAATEIVTRQAVIVNCFPIRRVLLMIQKFKKSR